MEKIKVGIVGLGLAGNAHIKGYLSNPKSEIVALCDVEEAYVKKCADEYGIPKYYTKYEEMLQDEDINLIDITTPTYLHTEMVLNAVKVGKHVHCEKPFSLTIQEGKKACAEAAKRGVSVTVDESYVFMSSIKKARELIDAGEIGKPTQIRERFGDWNERPGVLEDGREINDLHRGWRADGSKSGGYQFPWIFDHCVHFFAVAEYLMQDTKIEEVYSIMTDNSWMQEKESDRDENLHIGTEQDIAMLTWKYEDPACTGVWMRAEEVNGKYDYMTGFSVTVIGEKGMIEVLGEGGSGLEEGGRPVHLILRRKGGSTVSYCFDEGGDAIWQSDICYYNQAHANLINELTESLIKEKPSPYPCERAVHDLRTSVAAICSAKEGVPVKVSEADDRRMIY